MGVVFMIVAGGILGWLVAFVRERDTWRMLPRNVVTGIAGALLAGLLISPLFGGGNLTGGYYTVTALLVAMIGAVIALVSMNLLQTRVAG